MTLDDIVEQCDNCQDELDVGQIGLCDSCRCSQAQGHDEEYESDAQST